MNRAATLGSLALSLGVLCFALWLKSQPLNAEWMLALHAWRPDLPVLWAGLTLLGYGWALLMLVSGIDRAQAHGALVALLALVAGGLLSAALKGVWAWPRPLSVLPAGAIEPIGIAVRGATSFPSGHAMSAMATAALLVWLLPTTLPRRAWACAAVVVLGAAAAFSRIMVGAHWPADVLAGGALGWLFALACIGLLQRWPLAQRVPLKARLWIAIAVELAAAVSCLGSVHDYPPVVLLHYALALLMITSAVLRWRRVRALATGPAIA